VLTRRALLGTGMAALPLAAAARAWAWDGPPSLLAPAAGAIEKGLAYLAAQQHKDGVLAGSFGADAWKGNVAVTSLVGLAFLSGGHLPGRGPFAAVVENALGFVLRQAGPQGLLDNAAADPQGGRAMYSHGFGTLFLAEAHGTVVQAEAAEKVLETLRRAVRLLLATQNDEGGWRYAPEPVAQADLSVTAAQAMALRAARNVGVAVPRAAMAKCLGFLHRCQERPSGGFHYMPGEGRASFPLTAAGLAALHCCGENVGPAVEAARTFLAAYRPGRPSLPAVNPEYYLYGHYYAAPAMRQAGPAVWRPWYEAVRDELLAKPPAPARGEPAPNRRQADGSWHDPKHGAHYATAMACLILQVPKNYLPIFQN
jgi:hypothetical protein